MNKKLLLVADVVGWAWHRRAEGIARYSPVGVDVDVILESALRQDLVEQYDAVLHFSWPTARRMRHKRYWGFIANEGCMHPYPPDINDERLCVLTASKGKHRLKAYGHLARFSAGVVTINSKPELLEFLEPICERVVYLRTGVDCDVFKPTAERRPDAGKLRVGWCGKPSIGDRFSPKGYKEILLPLMAAVGNRIGDVEVCWNVNTRTHSTRLQTEEMVAWYNSLDVLLVTSSVEGTPSVLLEAMACGVPVVSTPVGIAREVKTAIGDIPGLMLTPGYETAKGAEDTIRAFRSWLEVFAGGPKGNRHLGTFARQRMEQAFDWRLLAHEWTEVLLG